MALPRSTDAAISAQGAAEDRIRRATALFASYNPQTGRNAHGKKAPAASKSRWPNEFKASLAETPEQYQSRRSQQAKDREAKKRAARGDTCARGHAITPETAITRGERTYPCSVCFYAWQERINDNRRRAYALLAVAA